jgi:hypothetical protein
MGIFRLTGSLRGAHAEASSVSPTRFSSPLSLSSSTPPPFRRLAVDSSCIFMCLYSQEFYSFTVDLLEWHFQYSHEERSPPPHFEASSQNFRAILHDYERFALIISAFIDLFSSLGVELVWYYEGSKDVDLVDLGPLLEKHLSLPLAVSVGPVNAQAAEQSSLAPSSQSPQVKAATKNMRISQDINLALHVISLLRSNSPLSGPLPTALQRSPLYTYIARQTIQRKGCAVVHCVGEADFQIEADLRSPALRLDGVISRDSDFFLVPSDKVYIPLDSISLSSSPSPSPSSSSSSQASCIFSLSVELWNRDSTSRKLESQFQFPPHSLRPDSLWALSCLFGNDYTKEFADVISSIVETKEEQLDLVCASSHEILEILKPEMMKNRWVCEKLMLPLGWPEGTKEFLSFLLPNFHVFDFLSFFSPCNFSVIL